MKIQRHLLLILLLPLISTCFFQCSSDSGKHLTITEGTHIALIGNNLGSRMMNYGYFETELYMRYPTDKLFIRNMCDGGDTPGFRPRASRNDPWAFPNAETFQTALAQNSNSIGHFESADEWLTRVEADVILAFFGFSESYEGLSGVETYKAELDAFIKHTLTQIYSGDTIPQLAVVSPLAFQDLSDKYDLPNGVKENKNLLLYTNAMREVTELNGVLFIDAYTSSQKWFSNKEELTIDGLQLNDLGYQKFSTLLVDKVFGKKKVKDDSKRESIHEAVLDKNWFWHNDYKIPNSVHVYGRRYNPFGPANYPAEIVKIREMTALRDEAIWKILAGEDFDLKAADALTTKLPPVESNFNPEDGVKYLYGDEALSKIHMAPGYKIELFASEKEFPDLANPSQISFDNKGRLWVAVMPTYPHYRVGDAKPNDKLIILEDTDGDYKADKQTIFVDQLHIPAGFEFAPEGVYISQGTNLKLFTDTDGDDKADKMEIVLSGFDDHDTHHVISAFCADPSGAIYMGEGVFLHTNVETPYGTVRGTNGGFYRYNPQRRQLERTAQLSIPNPWGIAFDKWGQNFFTDTSGPAVRWMMPGTIKSKYGVASPKPRDLLEKAHRVRPTSGLEFIHSRHFPDEVQGDLLVNNTIGFLGTKMHVVTDDTTGYVTKHRLDLVKSDDGNFRPVDMEFAPDGSLYMADWHNVLIGHMQHNARDPLRDHAHGRIYRITYPSRPLIVPAKVSGASIEELLNNLKLPEYRTRYRTRRELRERNPKDVIAILNAWIENLDEADPQYEHNLLEGLWVTWGLNEINDDLLRKLLEAEDFRARAAAVRVLRFSGHQMWDQAALIKDAAADENRRVRLEALVAGSWLDKKDALEVLAIAAEHPMDDWMTDPHDAAVAHTNGLSLADKKAEITGTRLTGKNLEVFTKGKEIYERDGYCMTCHQADGLGLSASGFPPIAGTKWAQGSEDRIIKLTLKGMYGAITVLDKKYPGAVPMTPFGGMLNDKEMASVLTYVRNAFGNEASVISPEKVKEVREQTKDMNGFYTPENLLKEHPLEK